MGARLAALARARGWTQVHAHSCARTAEIAMFASLLSGLPYSLTLHAPLGEFGPNHREKWRHARFAVIVTRSLRREVEEALSESLPPSVDVAPMGVELGSFTRGRPYQPWTGQVPLQIFSCGRLNPGKGHLDLIRAVDILRGRGIDARLTIAGEDEAGGTTYRRVLAARIAAMDLAGSVVLLGAVSGPRIRAELERAHVFALASLNEAIGVATMEAMAMETPVVVTGVGGVPELVDDGVNGLLVQPERPTELADKIEVLARDPALAHRLGDAGRRKVASEFSSSRSAEVLARRFIEPRSGAWPHVA
jgi:colanic acid/amylovoran biosynthesis glycosyltransferase